MPSKSPQNHNNKTKQYTRHSPMTRSLTRLLMTLNSEHNKTPRAQPELPENMSVGQLPENHQHAKNTSGSQHMVGEESKPISQWSHNNRGEGSYGVTKRKPLPRSSLGSIVGYRNKSKDNVTNPEYNFSKGPNGYCGASIHIDLRDREARREYLNRIPTKKR